MFQPQIKNLQKTNGVHKYIDYRKLFGSLLLYYSLWNKGKKQHENME